MLACVAGVPLVVHAVRRLLASERVERVLVEVGASDTDAVTETLTSRLTPVDLPRVRVVPVAGTDGALPDGVLADADVLLIHDLVHAFAGPELVGRVVDAVAAGAGAVLPVLPCTDTVKQLDAEGVIVGMPDRSRLRVAQTPYGFSAAALRSTPVAELLAAAHTVPGDPHARRLTSRFDLTVAEALLSSRSE